MKKIMITLSLLIITWFTILQSQNICNINEEPSILDNPPGCILENFPIFTNNFQATADTFDFDFACGTIENSLWFSFIPDSSGIFNIAIDGISCLTEKKGFEIGVYDLNLTRTGGCSASSGINSCLSVQYRLLPGEMYYLMIDGFQGAKCDFALRSNLNLPVELQLTSDIAFPNDRFCLGSEICYSFPQLSKNYGVREYRWTHSSGESVISGGGILDTFICLKYHQSGFREMGLTLSYNCTQQQTYSRSRFISGITETKTIRKTICEGETFTYDTMVYDQTILDFVLKENIQPNSCDSLIVIDLTVIDTSAPQIKCFKDTFINRIGIEWKKNENVTGYELEINDSIINIDNRFTYLVDSPNLNDTLNISLTPFSNNCFHHTGTAQCIDGETVVATKESEIDKIQLFPNPTSNFITIQSKIKIEKIQVLSTSGIFFESTQNSKIDLANHPAGIYFLKIKTSNGIIIKKIIKM